MYRFLIFIAEIEELNQDCVKISRPYRLYFPINKPSKGVTVGSSQAGSDRFIVLNVSARPKMVIIFVL